MIPHYEDFARKLRLAHKPDEPFPAKELNDWSDALELLLSCYALPENWSEAGEPKHPFPIVIAKLFLTQLKYLKAGQLTEPWSWFIRQGRHGMGPDELTDIGKAVAYIKAAWSGLVVDKASRATVAKAFSVTERTVTRWGNKNFDWVEPDDFFYGSTGPELSQKLGSAMREAGKRYQELGRSSVAISKRDRKRKPRKSKK